MSDRGRPRGSNQVDACGAEMATIATVVQSDALALGGRLAQFRAHGETRYVAWRVL